MPKDAEIMPEDTQRTLGRNAQRNNILAGKLVAETVRSTLGPKGMDKMLVDQMGNVTVTNDGATILSEIAIEHPAAKMIIEVAKTQEDEVGDGTTSAVIIAGALLKNAEVLLDKNIHPTVIIRGYRKAAEQANLILDTIAKKINPNDEQTLLNIAQTAMTGKGAEVAKTSLASLCVRAMQQVSKKNKTVDTEYVRIQTQVGSTVESSTLVDGLIVDKSRVHSGMPKEIKGAKILLYNTPIEIRDTETDAKITITDPSQMDAFLKQEEMMIKRIVDKIISTGANVVFCQKGIDDLAQHYLAKQGIVAMRRVRKSDMDSLSVATGARMVTNIDDASAEDLGEADIVKEVKIEDEIVTYVTGCKQQSIVTINLRGSTEHSVAEIKRAIEDAIGDIAAVLKEEKIVGGAGSTEMEVSKQLRQYASSYSGREQLAIIAFADAIESIPVTLAENAGLDPIDVITALKAAHDNNETWAGIDMETEKTIDAMQKGIIEPLKLKTQAINSATEVANMVLRIDDVIAAGVMPPPSAQQPDY